MDAKVVLYIYAVYFSQKQLPCKIKPRLVIIECAGYILWQFFLRRLLLRTTPSRALRPFRLLEDIFYVKQCRSHALFHLRSYAFFPRGILHFE